MEKIGDYWVPKVDVRGFKKRRRTEATFAHGDGPQLRHLIRAIELMKAERDLTTAVAIDAGANIGSFARYMATEFQHVHAFEPAEDTYACFARNIADWGLGGQVTIYQNALSDVEEGVRMGASLGRRSISREVKGKGKIPALPIDSLNLENVGFIKLDVEGYETKVINGALETLGRCRPFVMMEAKEYLDKERDEALERHRYLESLGYELVEKIGDPAIDWLYRPI